MSKQFPNPFEKWIPKYMDWRRKLPDAVSTLAVNEFKNNFRQGGWRQGSGVTKWEDRKAKDKNKKRRAILVKSGRLKRSLRKAPDYNLARVVTDVVYAQIHNEGGTITTKQTVKPHLRRNKKSGKRSIVKGHTRHVNITIPPRPFMQGGDGLHRDINLLLANGINEIFKDNGS